MRVLITGTAGRVGRAIYVELMKEHEVVGLDGQPCSTADHVGDIRDRELMESLVDGCDVIVHTAALHAPHVGLMPDTDFYSVNVDATKSLMRLAIEKRVGHFVFTSTTALYGHAATPVGQASWIDAEVQPRPRTIYHRTKIDAEMLLRRLSVDSGVPVTVLRMSRCFPEPADLMAAYRLHRGVDARDVANAHALAIAKRLPGFHRFIVSGKTPFRRNDCKRLYADAAELLRERVPALGAEFDRRGWRLPASIDRVYDSTSAQTELEWNPRHGFESVLEMLDDGSSEVLPVTKSVNR